MQPRKNNEKSLSQSRFHLHQVDIALRILRSFLLHIHEEICAQSVLHVQQFLPELLDLRPLYGEGDAHRAADFVLPHPFQFPAVLLAVAEEFLFGLGGFSGVVGVEAAEEAFAFFEEEEGVAGGAAHDGEEEGRAHHLDDGGEVLGFWAVEADAGEQHDEEGGAGGGELAQEEAVVVADFEVVVFAEARQGFLQHEAHLAGGEPVFGLLVGVDLGGQGRQGLDAEEGGGVVPEERQDGGDGEVGVLHQQVGEQHLGHAQHAAPAGVRGVLGGGQARGDGRAVGQQHVLFGVVEARVAEEGQQTGEHSEGERFSYNGRWEKRVMIGVGWVMKRGGIGIILLKGRDEGGRGLIEIEKRKWSEGEFVVRWKLLNFLNYSLESLKMAESLNWISLTIKNHQKSEATTSTANLNFRTSSSVCSLRYVCLRWRQVSISTIFISMYLLILHGLFLDLLYILQWADPIHRDSAFHCLCVSSVFRCFIYFLRGVDVLVCTIIKYTVSNISYGKTVLKLGLNFPQCEGILDRRLWGGLDCAALFAVWAEWAMLCVETDVCVG